MIAVVSNDTTSPSIMRSCDGDSTGARHWHRHMYVERPSVPRGAGVNLLACASLWIAFVLCSVLPFGNYNDHFHSLVAEAVGFSSAPRTPPSLSPTSFVVDERTRKLQQEEDWSTSSLHHPTSSPTSPRSSSSSRSTKKAKKQKKEKQQTAEIAVETTSEDAPRSLSGNIDRDRRPLRRGSSNINGQRTVVAKERPGAHGANPAFGLKRQQQQQHQQQRQQRRREDSIEAEQEASDVSKRKRAKSMPAHAHARRSRTSGSPARGNQQKTAFVRKNNVSTRNGSPKARSSVASAKARKKEKGTKTKKGSDRRSSKSMKAIDGEPSDERTLPVSSLERIPSSGASRNISGIAPLQRNAKPLPKRRHSNDKMSSRTHESGFSARKKKKSSLKKKRSRPKSLDIADKVDSTAEDKQIHPVAMLASSRRGRTSKSSARGAGAAGDSIGAKTAKKKQKKKVPVGGEADTAPRALDTNAKANDETCSSTETMEPEAEAAPVEDSTKKDVNDETCSSTETIEPEAEAAPVEDSTKKDSKSRKRKKRRKKISSKRSGDEEAVGSPLMAAAAVGSSFPLPTVEAVDVDSGEMQNDNEPTMSDSVVESLETSEGAIEASIDSETQEGASNKLDESPANADADDQSTDVIDTTIPASLESENEGAEKDQNIFEEKSVKEDQGKEVSLSEDVVTDEIRKDESQVEEQESDLNVDREALVDGEKPFQTETEEVDGQPLVEEVSSGEKSLDDTKNDAEETADITAPDTVQGESLADEESQDTTKTDTEEAEVDEEERTQIAANGLEDESVADEKVVDEEIEEGAATDDEQTTQKSADASENESPTDEKDADEPNEADADSDAEEEKVDDKSATQIASEAGRGDVPTDDKDIDEECEESTINVKEGAGSDENAGEECVEDEIDSNAEDSDETGNDETKTETAEVESSQATLEEEAASEADKQENVTPGIDSSSRGRDREVPSNKNKGMVDPEQDVVSFIEEVLQENVRSWIDDTSTDSNIENIVNKTRGGHSDSGNEDFASGLHKEDDEAVSPISDVTVEQDLSDDAELSAGESEEKLIMNRELLETSGDKDSDAVVSVVTWNLAEDSPSEEDAAFIRNFRKNGVSPGQGSDLVLISGQECENIKPRRSEGRRSREYRRLMIKMLGRDYVPVALHLLGGIQFGLFAKKSFLKEIEDITVADVTCGIGNVLHNKGAIAAFVTLKARNGKEKADKNRSKSLRMVFVTAHLAAHVKNAKARDADFWRISSELEAQAPEGFLPRKAADQNSGESFLFDSVDRVFFCGDLNYRLDLPRELTEYTLLHQTEYDQPVLKDLFRHDQLLRSMTERRAFPAFGEGKIMFMPTFKYDKESSSYDTSHKQRIPAWTDRILFQPVDGIRVLDYQSIPGAQSSDHRPVYGTYRIGMEGRVIQPSIKKRKRERLKESSSYEGHDY